MDKNNVTEPNKKILLTKQEVADIYGCSVGTINNLMKIKKLKYHKLGSMVRFRADELPILNKIA